MKTSDITLPKVVAKLKAIAKRDYNGELYENILSIFYQLEKDEREIFLRALYNLVTVIEGYPLMDRIQCSHTDSLPEPLKKEVARIEDIDFNKQELVKLKTWLTKAGAVILLIGFSVTIGLTVGLGGLAIKILDLIEGTFKVFKILFSM